LAKRHGDVVDLGELEHRLAERQSDLVEQRRRGHLRPAVITQERDDLTGDLQVRHVPVEREPVETPDFQRHVTSEQIVDVRDIGHRPPPTEDSLGSNDTAATLDPPGDVGASPVRGRRDAPDAPGRRSSNWLDEWLRGDTRGR
jgi:hypothetical protein